MDELIFRSSQKLDNFQVRLSLVASHSKDIFYQYSQQSKSLIIQAWNSHQLNEIKNNVKSFIECILEVIFELKYRIFFYIDPAKLCFRIVNFIGKKWTKREAIMGIGGFFLGGILGLAIGLAIRKPVKTLRYMQAVQFSNYIGPESVSVVEDAIAPFECGDHEILIDVKAASVQKIDNQITYGYGKNLGKILRKYYGSSLSEGPIILGRSCTGIVTDIGKKVKRIEIGEEVWMAVPFWSQGVIAQTVITSEKRVSRKPRNQGFEGTSSVPYAGCIALSVLNEADLTELNALNKRVLVHDAVSPVGCILIQILKHWGAQVTGTCNKRAVPVVKALGTDDIIVLNHSNLSDQTEQNNVKSVIMDLEDRKKFDLIILTSPFILPSEELIYYCNGKILSTVNSPLSSDTYSIFSQWVLHLIIWTRRLFERIFKITLNEYDEAHICYLNLDRLTELVENNYLQTVVDKVFPPQDVELALEHIESHNSIGSTIISFR